MPVKWPIIKATTAFLLQCALGLTMVRAQDVESPSSAPSRPLSDLSLEELMSIEVTSVAKQKQRLADVPAAVYVISQEEIRRSGMSSIPELIRLAPGMDVVRVNASQWGISARGFNDLFVNKMLVVVDGRSVYDPLFAGVFWDAQDLVLEDIERIEVVRGPGATLWGANAVNGVVSISTRDARQTQGVLVSGRAATNEGIGAVRYGGQLDSRTYYRIYTKYRTVDDFALPGDQTAHDGWDALRGGFRIDLYVSDQDTLTFQGDIHGTRNGQTIRRTRFAPPEEFLQDVTYDTAGGNVLGRWTHISSPTSDFALQVYYDRIDRSDPILEYEQDTVDLDFQHRFALSDRQELIWGAGYRFWADRINDTPTTTVDPDRRNAYLISAFVQDGISLVPDRLQLFLGSKFELNSYTGFEVQPGGRLLWTPDERQSVWAAVSRATRTPNRWEEDARTNFTAFAGPGGVATELVAVGNRGLDAEEVISYEAGYRVQPVHQFSLDTAVFVSQYDNLVGFRPGTPFLAQDPPRMVMPLELTNSLTGESYGIEIAANWNVADNWRLLAGYTWLQTHIHTHGSGLREEQAIEISAPQNQFQLRSYLDLTRHLQFNSAAYYVQSLADGVTGSYIRTDANLTWLVRDGWEMTVGVQNAQDDQHPEFFGGDFKELSTEVPRVIYLTTTIRY